jgi:Protein of unknown function (DUF2695)
MLMTREHPRWDEFCERLEGPGYCDFRETPNQHGKLVKSWTCAGGRDKSLAARLLAEMGLTSDEIAWSCEYFEAHGGFCDCEILFNVDRPER